MSTALMMLAVVIAAIPLALYAQSDVLQSDVSQPAAPQSDFAQSDATQTTAGKFTIAPDTKIGGVWRLNANTGELWFCLASAAPKCHLAENAKKK